MSLTADSRGKTTTITMKISIKLVFTIIFYFSFCISPSLPQDTGCPTYVDIPVSQPKYPTAGSASACRSVCLNNTGCNGFTQQSASSCQLNVGNANDINYNATTAVTYSVVLRTNCNTGQNCSWVARKFTFGRGGSRNDIATTINSCLMSCQADSTCIGLDWDSNQNSCWFFTSSGYPTATSDVVHHFDKSCSSASTIPTTTGSTSTSRTTLAASSSSASAGTSRATLAASSSSTSSGTTPTSTTVSSTRSTSASPCKTPCSGGSVCDNGFCVCNTVCTLVEDPVCGSDNATYGNECLFNMYKCLSSSNTTIKRRSACGAVEDWNPMAIKPAYIVLAGVGGGCLLLVLTAVIILCEYSMNDETFTHGVVKQPKQAPVSKQQQSQVEQIDIAVVDGENVEFNPYYNRSEIDAPDFTKEENLM